MRTVMTVCVSMNVLDTKTRTRMGLGATVQLHTIKGKHLLLANGLSMLYRLLINANRRLNYLNAPSRKEEIDKFLKRLTRRLFAFLSRIHSSPTSTRHIWVSPSINSCLLHATISVHKSSRLACVSFLFSSDLSKTITSIEMSNWILKQRHFIFSHSSALRERLIYASGRSESVDGSEQTKYVCSHHVPLPWRAF